MSSPFIIYNVPVQLYSERNSMNKTPLYNEHEKLNAKIVDFAGYLMPVYYDSIIQEHQAVRNKCGLFDVSHMGEIIIKGPDAFHFLQNLVPNNLSKLFDGKILYSPLCYENGGVVDDILIYRFKEDHYFIVVNASNVKKDHDWFLSHAQGYNISIENKSSELSMLAIQGPKAADVLQAMGFSIQDLKYYCFKEATYNKFKTILSRTGYTGEQGFELIIPNEAAVMLWKDTLKYGAPFSIKPIGLGARDTLRLEVCFSLYGHELNNDITPLEADIAWTVDFSKMDFIGKKALHNTPVKRKLAGFEMTERAIPRGGYKVHCDGKEIGFVTSGSFLPTVNKNMGLALINKDLAVPGQTIQISIRDRLYSAKVVSKPFFSPFNKR